MSENSRIEWTNHTFNPWIGCAKVSAGCKNCYAERQDGHRKWTPEGWGPGRPRRRTSAKNWELPLKWNRQAEEEIEDALHDFGADRYLAPHRPRVFCASLADWLDPEVPIGWRADLIELIAATPNLDWQLLTKRPELWEELMGQLVSFGGLAGELSEKWLIGEAPPNVWFGTSVENQPAADERIPPLLEIPAVVRFLSCEPLLDEVVLIQMKHDNDWSPTIPDGIHWVIVGGESGPKARPMHQEWAYSLKYQCEESEVAFFMKQMGGPRKPFPKIPEDLMVRQFPEVAK